MCRPWEMFNLIFIFIKPFCHKFCYVSLPLMHGLPEWFCSPYSPSRECHDITAQTIIDHFGNLFGASPHHNCMDMGKTCFTCFHSPRFAQLAPMKLRFGIGMSDKRFGYSSLTMKIDLWKQQG